METLTLDNGTLEVVATVSAGPRLLSFRRSGTGTNVLGRSDVKVETPDGVWRAIGGHRLWLAPETFPLSYAPDDAPVQVQRRDRFDVRLTQPHAIVERSMRLTLSAEGLVIVHTLTNRGDVPREMAAWALTIMAPGGVVRVPQEAYAPHSENFSAARPLVLWHYTNLADPRFSFTREEVRITPSADPSANKLGFGNTRGYASYELGAERFTKHFTYVPGARYPDYGCTTQVFVQGDFVELETLSPLTLVPPGGEVSHVEHWTVEHRSG